jgi:hypothetical protein
VVAEFVKFANSMNKNLAEFVKFCNSMEKRETSVGYRIQINMGFGGVVYLQLLCWS